MHLWSSLPLAAEFVDDVSLFFVFCFAFVFSIRSTSPRWMSVSQSGNNVSARFSRGFSRMRNSKGLSPSSISRSAPRHENNDPPVLCVDTCLLYTSPSPRD
eukprot:TRINITY_DN6141_c0_g2_i7.p1 TRINITY_DN6141_c0_g2~~TRINITY_DN6141_c0_g2_i7.p1  ORF type:complete len:101 (+),score=11.10 TRINITY_DN6141_c0_g2_i7:78-380(+)